MTTPIAFVFSATTEFAPVSVTISPLVAKILEVMRFFHRFWWVYQKQIVYRKPENWLCLAGGHYLNATLGNGSIKLCLQIYTVAIRTLRVTREVQKLQDEWVKLQEALRGDYPIEAEEEWPASVLELDFPGYGQFQEWRSNQLMKIAIMRRICSRALTVFIRIFTLSMRCLDAYEAFRTPDNDEIILDGIEGVSEILKRKAHIIYNIKKSKPIVEKLVSAFQISKTADEVIGMIEKTFDHASFANKTIKKISYYTGDFLIKVGKETILLYASMLGLTRLLPWQFFNLPDPNLTAKDIESLPPFPEIRF